MRTHPRAYGVRGEPAAGVDHEARCFAYPSITPLATPVMEVELHDWVDRITVILAVRVFACVGLGEAQAMIYGGRDFEAKEHRPAVTPVRNPHSTRATIEHVLAAARCTFVVRGVASRFALRYYSGGELHSLEPTAGTSTQAF